MLSNLVTGNSAHPAHAVVDGRRHLQPTPQLHCPVVSICESSALRQEVECAWISITLLLRGQRKKGKNIKSFQCDSTARHKLERMEMMMRLITHSRAHERKSWIQALLQRRCASLPVACK
jgi:hypothetical protein